MEKGPYSSTHFPGSVPFPVVGTDELVGLNNVWMNKRIARP